MNKKQISILILGLLIVLAYATYVYNDKQTTKVEVPKRMSDVEIEAYIANPPGPNATQQEGWDFYNRVELVAVKADSLDITGCKPLPQVISIKKGTALTLKNNDTAIHTLAFNQQYSIAGHAQTETVTNLNLGDLTGVFPYSCDMKSNAGYILITE